MYLLQEDKNGFLGPNTAVVYQLILEHNWLYPDKKILYRTCPLKTAKEIARTNDIPVGSLDFVQTILNTSIQPILIPNQLQTHEFLHRKVSICNSQQEIAKTAVKWNAHHVFVKSASQPKCDYGDFYSIWKVLQLPKDRYFVSEIVDFISEWRCFVYQGKLVGARPYDGDEWIAPHKETVEKMIAAYQDAPEAYTLDAGVIRSETGLFTAAIEVHDFVSCGLYGFEDPVVLKMLEAGVHNIRSIHQAS